MARAEPAQLEKLRRRMRELANQLASPDFISSGSVVSHLARCGKPGCRCQANPPQLHGPYWNWSRTVSGRTVNRHLSAAQAQQYKGWIANRRRLMEIIDEMEEVSSRAIDILLAGPALARPPSPRDSSTAPSRRVSRLMVEALAELPDLAQEASEAAQELLDARDGDDREAIAQARAQLLAVLDSSPDFARAIDRVLPLLQSGRSKAANRQPLELRAPAGVLL